MGEGSGGEMSDNGILELHTPEHQPILDVRLSPVPTITPTAHLCSALNLLREYGDEDDVEINTWFPTMS